jgi:hypothetical protein
VVEGGKLLHRSPSGVLASPSGRGVWFVAWRLVLVMFALYCPCVVCGFCTKLSSILIQNVQVTLLKKNIPYQETLYALYGQLWSIFLSHNASILLVKVRLRFIMKR